MSPERLAEIREEIEPRDIEEYAVARELLAHLDKLRAAVAEFMRLDEHHPRRTFACDKAKDALVVIMEGS